MLQVSFHIEDKKWKSLVAASQDSFRKALEAAFNALVLPRREFAVAVSFVDDAEIQKLNGEFRYKDKPTNVLSFPMIEEFSDFSLHPKQIPIELGDIVLAFETIENEARMEDKTMSDHVCHLLVHGLLHLFGYDHMTKKDEKEMEALEVSILGDLGISNPYL